MDLKIGGVIVGNDEAWLYDLFDVENTTPAKVADAIKAAAEAHEDLTVEINSVGGSVFAGFEIYSALRKAQSKGIRCEAHVTALAASAASTVMVACEPVLLSPVAQVMIHQPSSVTEGNIDDHKQSVKVLQSLEESILNGYVAKARGRATREQLKALVDKESWLPAQKAVELGLADGLLSLSDEESSALMGDGVSSVLNSFTNAWGAPSSAELLKRYEKAVAEGRCSAVPGHPVQVEGKGWIVSNVQQEDYKPQTPKDSPEELTEKLDRIFGAADAAANFSPAADGNDVSRETEKGPENTADEAQNEPQAADTAEDWTRQARIDLERARYHR